MEKYFLLMVIPMVVMCTPAFYTSDMRDDVEDDVYDADEAMDIRMDRSIPRHQIEITPTTPPNEPPPVDDNEGSAEPPTAINDENEENNGPPNDDGDKPPNNDGDRPSDNDGNRPPNNDEGAMIPNEENEENNEDAQNEDQKPENPSQTVKDEDEIVDAEDKNLDPKKETDIIKINQREQNKTGHFQVVTDPERPGWHLSGDVWFSECEMEDLFGTTNYPNPKCAKKKKNKHGKRDATTKYGSKWDLPIPYQLDSSIGSSAKEAIEEGMDEIKAKTCITFEKTTSSNKDYFWFWKGKGCSSHVGRTTSYHKHKISIGSGCDTKATTTHEMMHALGFWHEQQRTDRDTYVTINWKNIDTKDDDPTFNFKKVTTFVDTYGYDYDYRSVMHYKKTAFGIPTPTRWWPLGQKETITPKQDTDLGQDDDGGLSKTDALQLNERYCNDPKTTIDLDVLKKELKRWMAIYEDESNDVFRGGLMDHFEKIYPQYFLTVSAYDAVGGWDKHAFHGWCAHQWRAYDKNAVICYARRTSRFPSQSEQERIMGEVVNHVKGKGCDSRTIMESAETKAESYGYPILAVHVVVHGSGLRSRFHTASTKFENFKCQGDKQSSLILVFGSR